MPRLSDPRIDPDGYILEAVDAFCLICEGRGPRDALLREAFRSMALLAVGLDELRVSDLDRLHALFGAAVDAQDRLPQGEVATLAPAPPPRPSCGQRQSKVSP